jgi:DHA1 family tetracycline resistance protein-like MFS transporter
MKPNFPKSTLAFIIFTVFLAVMGIGVIIPVIPFIVEKYVGSNSGETTALYVGLLTSIYSVCQFFAAPVLGALSDKFGRRPVLLLCLLGSAIGYILFGIAGSVAVLFIGRIIDGLTGGDISTIFAYVADITEPKERGKIFGIIGAVAGFGFILGPTLGGFAANISLTAPVFIAAGITVLNMLFGMFVLPESLDKEHRTSDFTLKHLNPALQLQSALKNSALKVLLIIGFFYFFPFSQLQGINSVYLKDVLHFDPSAIGLLFLLIGGIDIFTQGYLSGKLMPKFKERKLMGLGYIFVAVSFLTLSIIPTIPSNTLLIIGIIIYAFGSGFIEPAFGSLISQTAKDPGEQGKIQGASQSMQSITRIFGPLFAAFLYQFSPAAPYVSCVIFCLVGLWLISRYKQADLSNN